jgi:hypothetical protein
MKLAIDIGFSSVKIVGANGIMTKFPIAVAVYNKPQVELGVERKKPSFYNGKYYLIGEDAIGEPDVKYSLEIDFLIEYAPLFISKAIEKLEGSGYGVVDEISLGLPIEYYRKYMLQLWDKVKDFTVNNRHYLFFGDIITDKKGIKVSTVHPQGGGILVDYILKNNINTAAAKDKGFILDIGYNTVIVLAFDKGYAGVSSNSKQYSKLGFSRVSNDLEQKLARDYGINDKTKIEIAQILTDREIKIYGKTYDLSGYIDEITANYMESIILRIQSDYETKFRQADKLIIAGGGAYHIKNSLPEKYKDLVYIMDLPEFSNARGFYFS